MSEWDGLALDDEQPAPRRWSWPRGASLPDAGDVEACMCGRGDLRDSVERRRRMCSLCMLRATDRMHWLENPQCVRSGRAPWWDPPKKKSKGRAAR